MSSLANVGKIYPNTAPTPHPPPPVSPSPPLPPNPIPPSPTSHFFRLTSYFFSSNFQQITVSFYHQTCDSYDPLPVTDQYIYLPSPRNNEKDPPLQHSPTTPHPPPSISTLPNCPIFHPLLPQALYRLLQRPTTLQTYQSPTTPIPNFPQFSQSITPPSILDYFSTLFPPLFFTHSNPCFPPPVCFSEKNGQAQQRRSQRSLPQEVG